MCHQSHFPWLPTVYFLRVIQQAASAGIITSNDRVDALLRFEKYLAEAVLSSGTLRSIGR